MMEATCSDLLSRHRLFHSVIIIYCYFISLTAALHGQLHLLPFFSKRELDRNKTSFFAASFFFTGYYSVKMKRRRTLRQLL